MNFNLSYNYKYDKYKYMEKFPEQLGLDGILSKNDKPKSTVEKLENIEPRSGSDDKQVNKGTSNNISTKNFRSGSGLVESLERKSHDPEWLAEQKRKSEAMKKQQEYLYK